MRPVFVSVGLCAALLSSRARAQSCSGGAYVVDACRKAVDLVLFLTPQLATAQAGGSATPGQGGALGKLGSVLVDVRATAVLGTVPQLAASGFSPAASASSYAGSRQLIPAISANLSVGLLRGVSLGVTHVGALDALVTATYLRGFEAQGVRLSVKGGDARLGFGARVGVLEESLISPGVSLTWLRRDLPSVSLSATVAGNGATNPGGSVTLSDFAVKTTAWRVTASKSLPLLGGLSVGFGQDQYDMASRVDVSVNGAGSGSGSASLAMTRSSMFAGVSLNLGPVRLVGEVGQATGGKVPVLLNSFGAAPNQARTYATASLRIAF